MLQQAQQEILELLTCRTCRWTEVQQQVLRQGKLAFTLIIESIFDEPMQGVKPANTDNLLAVI